MEVTTTYSCSICNEPFDTKSDRDNHIRRFCQSFIKLSDLDGNIQTIQRIDEKFECPNCDKQFNRGNHLQTHWKRCQRGNANESKYYIDILINFNSAIE